MRIHRRGRPPYPGILTPAEQHVLEHLRHGLTNVEIAYRLEISPDGVKYHISNMLGKLNLPDRYALAKWEPMREDRASSLKRMRLWLPLVALPKTAGVVAGGALLVALGLGVVVASAGVRGDGDSLSIARPTHRAATPKPQVDTGYGWNYVIDSVARAGQQVTIHYHIDGNIDGLMPNGPAPQSTDGQVVALLPHGPQHEATATAQIGDTATFTVAFQGAVRFVPAPLSIEMSRSNAGWIGDATIAGRQVSFAAATVPETTGTFTEVTASRGLLLDAPGTPPLRLRDDLGNTYALYHGTHNSDMTSWDFEGPVDASATKLVLSISGYARAEDGGWTLALSAQ